MDLADRVVLVTGVRRIGAAVAVEMARRGADVGVSYRRSAAEAERVAAAVSKHGRRSFLGQADLTDESACRRLVDSTVAELGRLDVLINMASSYAPTPFADLTGEDLDRALAVDVKAAFLCTLAAVPHLRAVGGGRVVNVSDWVARSGRPRYPGFLTYYVAKSAVIGMTEALALELAPEQILVNAIAPGPIRAPSEMAESEVEEIARVTPLGRWGGDQEVVKVICALVESDFITGETIRVDGGRHLK